MNYKQEVLKQFPNAEIIDYHSVGSSFFQIWNKKEHSKKGLSIDELWKDFYEKYCTKTMIKEELLDEAKRRYPIGVKIKPLNIKEGTREVYILENIYTVSGHYWAIGSDCPSSYTDEGVYCALYLYGKWAEIIEQPNQTTMKHESEMSQHIIRTHKGSDYSNVKTVNEYLRDGWIVLLVTPIGDSLEYVLQKDSNQCNTQ